MDLSRRDFFKASGAGLGGIVLLGTLGEGAVLASPVKPIPLKKKGQETSTICPYDASGCGFITTADASGKLIAANDDYEGAEDYSSQIVWRAMVNGVYYLHTENRAGLYGCQTDYEVWIEQLEGFLLFLPVIAQDYGAPAVVEQHLPPIATEPDLDLATTAPGPQVVVSPSGVITHTCKDDYEIDDTWWQSKPIEDGAVQVHSFDSDPLRYAADKDWMWFDIQSGRTITFTLPSITNTQTLLELYHDPEDAPVAKTTDPSLVWTAPYGGRYYLSVSPSHDPTQVSFGCADEVGYKLLAEVEPRWYLYLPVVIRQVGTP